MFLEIQLQEAFADGILTVSEEATSFTYLQSIENFPL